MEFRILFILLALGLRVYPVLFVGWISNCNYAILGFIVSTIISFDLLFIKLILYRIIIYKIKIDITNPITPPNLFGIARKIEYTNRKYHSDLMRIGVFIGFAILKLSGSPRW